MKHILLITDDPRSQSGVGTQAQNIIRTTAHKYKYTVIGAALQHPHPGQIADVSGEWGLPFGHCDIIGSNGYGNIVQIRSLIKERNIDAIMLMTDPRFHQETVWAHNLEFNIPILYYWLWDAFPTPLYNRAFIQSCDWVGSISKQSDHIAKSLDPSKQPWQYDYIPHGVDLDLFKPRPAEDPDVMALKEEIFKGQEKDFVVLFVNRNARRKQPGQLLLGWKKFQEQLTPEQAAKTALVMHTEKIDDAGTDLPLLVKDLSVPNVYFNRRIDRKLMGPLNSMADCIINVSSAEGFGLNVLEGIMSAKMVIANRTGGLKDQTDGPWAETITPTPYLTGSPITPYINEDVPAVCDIANALKKVYDLDPTERERRGALGREFAINAGMTIKTMGERFMKAYETIFTNWKPTPKSFKVYGTTCPRVAPQVAELELPQHETNTIS